MTATAEIDAVRQEAILSSLAGFPFLLVYSVAWIASAVLSYLVTVEILDYLGAGYWRLRHRGALLDGEQYWDSIGSRGAKLLRRPAQAWWVLLTEPRSGTAGWILMVGYGSTVPMRVARERFEFLLLGHR